MLHILKKHYLTIGIIASTTLLSSSSAFAKPVADAGEASARIGQMSNATLNGILATVGLIGVVMFLVNGYKLFFGGEQGQETKGKQFKGLIGGAFLSAPLIFLAMFTQTFSGATVTEASLKETISEYSVTSDTK